MPVIDGQYDSQCARLAAYFRQVFQGFGQAYAGQHGRVQVVRYAAHFVYRTAQHFPRHLEQGGSIGGR